MLGLSTCAHTDAQLSSKERPPAMSWRKQGNIAAAAAGCCPVAHKAHMRGSQCAAREYCVTADLDVAVFVDDLLDLPVHVSVVPIGQARVGGQLLQRGQRSLSNTATAQVGTQANKHLTHTSARTSSAAMLQDRNNLLATRLTKHRHKIHCPTLRSLHLADARPSQNSFLSSGMMSLGSANSYEST